MSKSKFITVPITLALLACSPCFGSDWVEDFESYSLGAFPSEHWTSFCGNTDMSIATDPRDPSNKVFRLYGVVGARWAAGANREYTVPDEFTISLRVYNGGEAIPIGGHQVRAEIATRQGICWTEPGRSYISFHKNGNVYAADGTTVLQTYEVERWYDVRISYSRSPDTLTFRYWIDDTFRGEVKVATYSGDPVQNRIELVAQAGTAYFDDVTVTADSPTCYADCDGNGMLDIFDFLCFQNEFAAGCP